uniref:Monocopper oxidase-like protein SKU5 n=1 Tax=Kalanchoe fedtschenkoi TaxID=63787 RepID=A0A7N0SYU5_KALFE
MFPEPVINATTNDFIHVNVFNNIDEPLLFTWNGIQQRLNSWQDGVSGTNCPIQPGANWTYEIVFAVPFPKPDAEFDLLIGDWTSNSYKSFNVDQGGTYRFRISNVGSALSYNFRIQGHQMVLVETEGSYTQQITLDSLDVHVGQSYSVLVTMTQKSGNYYMVASPKLLDTAKYSSLVGVGVLQYANSAAPLTGPLPNGPDAFDIQFSLAQARSIRWNMTAGAARPNPQGTFNVTLSQTFILRGSLAEINGSPRYTVNNVSYSTPDTPLKLADHFLNGTGVYTLDQFPVQSVKADAASGVSVVTGIHKGWIEMVFQNDLDAMDSWHLDGFSFFVVGFGGGDWTPDSRSSYNLLDPVARSTTQVYPGGWTAVYAYLDNPGMWNLRSQTLKNWYLGQQLYVRVHNSDPAHRLAIFSPAVSSCKSSVSPTSPTKAIYI